MNSLVWELYKKKRHTIRRSCALTLVALAIAGQGDRTHSVGVNQFGQHFLGLCRSHLRSEDDYCSCCANGDNKLPVKNDCSVHRATSFLGFWIPRINKHSSSCRQSNIKSIISYFFDLSICNTRFYFWKYAQWFWLAKLILKSAGQQNHICQPESFFIYFHNIVTISTQPRTDLKLFWKRYVLLVKRRFGYVNDTKYKEMLHCTDRCCIVLNCNIVSTYYTVAKSVTAVDTISATVIFYLFPFWGRIWHETGDIPKIFSCEQIVCPDLMRPWSEKTGLDKMTIVIRI